jgi:hypothetical protein
MLQPYFYMEKSNGKKRALVLLLHLLNRIYGRQQGEIYGLQTEPLFGGFALYEGEYELWKRFHPSTTF